VVVNELSFDPAHLWCPVPGLPGAEWSVEVFTIEDVRLLDPQRTTGDETSLTCDGLRWPGGQRAAPGSVHVDLAVQPDVVTWSIRAEADIPIKGVKLLLRGLPIDDAGEWWSPTTACDITLKPSPDAPVKLRYPWPDWQTPWVCSGEGPAVALSVRDSQVAAKRFYAFLPPWSPGPVVEVVCDQLATRYGTVFELPTIRLTRCADAAAVHADLDAHLAHLESAFGLTPWEQRSDAPAWADDIRLVVTLHGQHWTGHVFNTFDDMGRILDEVTSHIPGEQVLAYLPGWEGRYYWQYPVYEPGVDLGGPEAFTRLCEKAKCLGVHLMPMFGANGANVRRHPQWEQAALRSPTDRYVVNVNHPDWDGDRKGEDEQVFLNPGEPTFQMYLRQQIEALLASYDVAGIFLDTSACWFDDPRNDLFEGYRQLCSRLRQDRPGLLICGEGWYDALLGVLPMNQTWLDISRPTRTADLPYRYSRLLGHLYSGCPGQGSTGVHEGGFRPVAKSLGLKHFAPSLGFVGDTLDKYHEDVVAFCREVVAQHEDSAVGPLASVDGRREHQ